MAVKILSAAFIGIEGKIVTVEVDISRGLPALNIVGLADTAVKESKERVRAAILNSGFDFPVTRMTVNLAPADLKKEGCLYDLPIAIGILLATKQISIKNYNNFIFVGELSLSGELRKIRGVLPIVIEAKKKSIKNIILPQGNVKESSLVNNVNLYPFESLKDLVSFFRGKLHKPYNLVNSSNEKVESDIDFSQVIGQESTKRAVEIAAAGFHNIILYGPPGSGKSMIAKRIPTILPKLSYDEALEVTKIYSVSGKLSDEDEIISSRPFRSPHHTCSAVSLVGGGSNIVPGEISLAHNGVLYLDEILEFKSSVLDVLRQPIEDKKIKISRASGSITFPANFMLVGSMNPCICGNLGSTRQCTCTNKQKEAYLKKLSNPMLDRIDIMVPVRLLPYKYLKEGKKEEDSNTMRNKVLAAMEIQSNRFKHCKISFNSQMEEEQIKRFCILNSECEKLMENIYKKYKLSTRGYMRILKVSRTIADIAQRDYIEMEDLMEAVNYRRYINNKII